jgi:hypothetical protein
VVAGLMDRALTDQVPERISGPAVRDHRDRHTGVYRPSRHRCRRPTPAAYSRCSSRRRAG